MEEELYLSIGRQFSDAVQSQMFGKPCFKINGKAFICFFQNESVFKLPENIVRETLALEGSHLFDPSGKNRPMKEWVQVPYMHKDKWHSAAQAAFKYVIENNK